MSRRSFFSGWVLVTAAAGWLLAVPVASGEIVRKAYKVKGFTWVGCASSLEAVLRKTEGVKEVKATFSEAKVEVVSDDKVVSEKQIVAIAKKAGFTFVNPDSADPPKKRR